MALNYTTGSAVKTRVGIDDSEDDAILSSIATATNEWIETYVGMPVGPDAVGTYTFDGDGTNVLHVARGIRAVTGLEVSPSTGEAREAVPSGEIFLRPPDGNRRTGWPATEIWLSEHSVHRFWFGLDTVEVVGSFGFAAIPAEVSEVAIVTATRAWRARQSGQTDIVGNDETGTALISRFVAPEHKAVLRMYKVDRMAVG